MSSGAQTGSDTGPADDAAQLRQEIQQTRERMGETVEQLAAKADIKARAQVKMADVRRQVKDAASRTRTRAAARAKGLRDQLTGPSRSGEPGRTRQAIAGGARSARQHRTPLAAAAGVLVVSLLAIRWWRRR